MSFRYASGIVKPGFNSLAAPTVTIVLLSQKATRLERFVVMLHQISATRIVLQSSLLSLVLA